MGTGRIRVPVSRRDENSSEAIFPDTILVQVGKNCNDRGQLIWPEEADPSRQAFSTNAKDGG
jgi:hypothetical protein